MMIDDIITNIVTDVKDLHNDVGWALQKRKNIINIIDVFRLPRIASSNGSSYTSNTSDHNLFLTSSGNLSYWTVKLYNLDFSHHYKDYYDSYYNLPSSWIG
jgi:hypothetical protein